MFGLENISRKLIKKAKSNNKKYSIEFDDVSVN